MSNYAKLGNYLLIEKQEETGIAEWWRGATLEGQKIENYYLVDVINSALVADRGFVDHYLNQSTITTKLEHPNILRKATSTFENQTLASIFEFHEGFSLEKVLERCREDGFPLAIDHALLVGSKLLSALAYAKGKHITHGFLNPSVVFVTHEGEIKLKGFSVSSALRHFSGVLPFGDRYKTYVPQGVEMLSDDRDHLDIYGVGSILFEMLTGETMVEASGGSAAEKIANALTAADGEAIPDKIASILNKSLDANQPDSYHDIQVMAKDMEDLLFSGEYSPTTFNLAFFMHSAFRVEMEEMNEKIATEREQDFGAIAIAAAPKVAAAPSAAPPSRSEVTLPEASAAGAAYAAGSPAEKKGGLPIVPIAIGVAVIVIAVVAFMMLGGGGDQRDKQVDQIAQQLAEEGRLAEQEELKRQQEELIRQNQMLMEQIEDQRRKETEEEKALLEADMQRMDQEIARLQREQKQKQELEKLELDRKRLAEEKAKVEQAQKAAEDRRRKREEAQRLAKEKEQAEAERLAQGEQAVKQPQTGTPKSPGGDGSQVAKNSPDGVADNNAGTDNQASGDVILSEDSLTAYGTPSSGPADIPNEGDLVEFDDPYLMPPVLLESYTPQDAPRKAVRAGLVQKGGTLNFYMRVLVNTQGEVEDVELFRSPLSDNSNDFGMIEKATKVVGKLRFSVPRKHDVKVKTWWFIPVIFKAK